MGCERHREVPVTPKAPNPPLNVRFERSWNLCGSASWIHTLCYSEVKFLLVTGKKFLKSSQQLGHTIFFQVLPWGLSTDCSFVREGNCFFFLFFFPWVTLKMLFVWKTWSYTSYAGLFVNISACCMLWSAWKSLRKWWWTCHYRNRREQTLFFLWVLLSGLSIERLKDKNKPALIRHIYFSTAALFTYISTVRCHFIPSWTKDKLLHWSSSVCRILESVIKVFFLHSVISL